jgi:hypothetical protein
MTGKIDFNFTAEQKIRFREIFHETERLYPELVSDKVVRERTKVLIAHTVINGDLPLDDIKEEKANETIELKD